jgi:enoyl-CoA hydratase/carnithine racemase
MFSHIMVGSNDIARSKKFYDALFVDAARLQKMIGITRAKDIVMRSRRMTGRQACDWGIATDCVPDGEFEAATDALVDELRVFAPSPGAPPRSC